MMLFAACLMWTRATTALPACLEPGSELCASRHCTHNIPYHTITITYRIKPLCLDHGHGLGLGHGTSQISKGQGQQANGHKLVAMAQDIRYPGVRVGEACGQQTARLPWLRDAKVVLTITIPLPYGIKPLCLGQRHGIGQG